LGFRSSTEIRGGRDYSYGFYNRILHPEDEIRYSWACLLGAALVTQKKYAAAESRLLDSYNGRIHRKLLEVQLNLFTAQEAAEWLVRLYDEWGKPEEAAKWREKLGAVREECRRREALALKPPTKIFLLIPRDFPNRIAHLPPVLF